MAQRNNRNAAAERIEDDSAAGTPPMLDELGSELDDSPLPAKDNDGVPYCRRHHCRMKQYTGTTPKNPKAYFACVVPDCGETARMIKTPRESVVPNNPVTCQRCSKPGEPVYCVRNDQVSTAGSVIVQCPLCHWKSNAMPVPQLAAAHFARTGRPRPLPVDEIGAR